MKTQMFGFLYAMGASLVLAASVHAQTTYYVNGDCGSNAWSGTGPVCAAPDGPKATIQAGISAASNGDEVVVADGVYTGAGNKNLDFAGRLITLRSANGPEGCIIDCQGSGRGFYFHSGETTDAVVQGFTITNGWDDPGGAIRFRNSGGTIISCILIGNSAGASGGGGIATENSTVTVAACLFIGNSVEGAGGGMLNTVSGSISVTDSAFLSNWALSGGAMLNSYDVTATLQSCTFTDNAAGFVVGGFSTGDGATTLINCTFTRNSSDSFIGGMADQADATLVNCVFSRNSGELAGGLFTLSDSTLINSTFSGNFGGGFTFAGDPGAPTDVTLANCILWGNSPHQIEEYADTGAGGTATVSYSDIQGGWSGPGGNNIDADPLFVQPGLDNVRLSFGSPCLNVGSNAALPPDEFDLDGDGDTDEPIPYDLDGNDRIQAGIVDMGAYEGEHEPLPPGSSASDMDLDQGETAFLIPGGGLFDPLKSAAVVFTNVSGPDNASVTVTEWYQSVHPGAGGYSDLTSTLTIETSLNDGQFLALVLLPFNPDVLGGIDPFQPNLTSFDPTIGNWALAVAGNTVNSPGFPWP
ncbi:MAG: right-handed parallel beta-helix repeat-containing protein, partial [Planctomycetota bacterium]|nr:right-handed parallel beta-helix repeat-containing protein [Planctomycetota bacterium]